MTNNNTVTREEWLAARKELLLKEKQASKQREELTQLRQQMPRYRLPVNYGFEGPDGKVSLSDLFGSSSQLLIYHFMYGPDWPEGCPACSMMADHYNPLVLHLKARDVAFATVSRAPIESLLAYRKRMNWNFTWVSSLNCDFNQDFGVTYTQQEIDEGTADYNYGSGSSPTQECPGLSCFSRDDDGIFHTYSTYARGLENFLGIYNYLDIVPQGRNEDQLPFSMAWVKRHDVYGQPADDNLVRLDPE